MSQISQVVREVIAEQLDRKPEEIRDEDNFVLDLKSDSLNMVEIIMALEEKFNCEIKESDAEKIVTVGDAIKYIEALNKVQ